ncbi:MAG: hypothetical protein BGO43_13370 [Gammaproteobacteria bacterium 39-13]|nr:MAPEG family protein [Gammaproteobacteria bacterium]OJV85717.1 MAG: hypothetical protein BGO43_13370 [Gammaproteobacteria bacterium 39-13]
MTTLAITGLYASLLSFLIIVLGARISHMRMKYRVGLLDGGHPQLTHAIRVHGNAVEWVPLVLILFACAESQHLPYWALHLLGITLIMSRLLHAWGVSHSSGKSFGRFYGIMSTWLIILILGIYNLYAFIMTR